MRRGTRRLLTALLGVALALVAVLGTATKAFADNLDPVTYLDADGTEKSIANYTVVSSDETYWREGWYVVKGDVDFGQAGLSIEGDVNLILCDGAKLTIQESIVAYEASITIYAQSTGGGMGSLESSDHIYAQDITINGGAIGVGGIGANSTVAINGGAVYSDGGNNMPGIYASAVTINGGEVYAKSDAYFGIESFQGGTVIKGGTVTAVGVQRAIQRTLRNAIPGTGWTDVDGTEGEAPIAVNTDPGQQLESYKKVQFPAAAAKVKTPPKAIEGLVEDGSAQELVTAGEAEGGTMQYALGKDAETAPDDGWGEAVPTGTEAGTYYVWYRAAGDDTHADSDPACVEATIGEAGRVPIYRMYNTVSSEHLYTTSEAEYASCGKGAYKDWRAEGVEWLAPAKGQEGARPVRRLYNKGLGDHHYAAEGEAKLLVEKHGWVDEGVAFYTMDEGVAPLGLHRLYNPGLTRGQHHYTASDGEAKALVSQHGWVDEGMAFWGWEPAA